MLNNPPCIGGLVGCESSDSGTNSSSQSSLDIPHWNGYGSNSSLSVSSWQGYQHSGNSNSNNYSSFGSSSSPGGFSWTGSQQTGGSPLSNAKDKIASYLLTVKNKTGNYLSGVKVFYPAPSGSEFDPALSSPACVAAAGTTKGVECSMDLGPNESKTLKFAYRAKNSLSCLWQKAKTMISGLTGDASAKVETSVACSVSQASSSSSGNLYGYGQQSSSSGSAGASAGSVLSKTKDKTAMYVITAKNKTGNILSGVKIAHGPTPTDAEFDPALSSPSCRAVAGANNGVECSMDLGPNESRTVNVAYKAKNSLSCLLFRTLQKAKATIANMTGDAYGKVETSVACSVSRSSSSGSAYGQSNSLPSTGFGAGTNPNFSAGFGQSGGASGFGAGLQGGASGTPEPGGQNLGQNQNSSYPVYVYNPSSSSIGQILPQTGINQAYYLPRFSKLNLVSLADPEKGQTEGLPLYFEGSALLAVVFIFFMFYKTMNGLTKWKIRNSEH